MFRLNSAVPRGRNAPITSSSLLRGLESRNAPIISSSLFRGLEVRVGIGSVFREVQTIYLLRI